MKATLGVAFVVVSPAIAGLPSLWQDLWGNGELLALEHGNHVTMRLRHDAGVEGSYDKSQIEIWQSTLQVRSQIDTGGISIWHQEGSGICRFRVHAPSWAMDVSPVSDDHRLGARAGKTLQFMGELGHRDGGMVRSLGVQLLQPRWKARVDWALADRQERWAFTQVTDTNHLELDWRSHVVRKAASLELHPMAGVSVRAGLNQDFMALGMWQDWGVGDSGQAVAWNLGVGYAGRFGYVGWNGYWRRARLTTMGWKNDDGERRVFHELSFGLDRNCQTFEWSGRLGKILAGAEEIAFDISRPKDRREFLFWNALDGSPWASLITVLYSRSDFLEGFAKASHRWLELEREFALGPVTANGILRLDRMNLDGEIRWRRREIQGFGLVSEKDTTRKSVDLIMLQPKVALAFPLAQKWSAGLDGGGLIPLRVTSKAPKSSPEASAVAATSADVVESLAGGWFIAGRLRFSF